MPDRQFFDELPSTQLRALELVRAGGEPGTRVVAARQTAGRGRGDHLWASPPGGLYLSIVCLPPPAPAGLFPIAVAECLRQHLEDAYGCRTHVKWPNDLLVVPERGPPAKLAGILADLVSDAPGGPRLVVGVGVNVRAPRAEFPEALRDRVAVLSELTSYPPDVDQVESEVADVVDRTLELLETAPGRAALVASCRRALYGRGRRARLDGQPVGVVRDLGDEGELWVEDGRGRRAVWAGDLTVEEGS